MPEMTIMYRSASNVPWKESFVRLEDIWNWVKEGIKDGRSFHLYMEPGAPEYHLFQKNTTITIELTQNEVEHTKMYGCQSSETIYQKIAEAVDNL